MKTILVVWYMIWYGMIYDDDFISQNNLTLSAPTIPYYSLTIPLNGLFYHSNAILNCFICQR